MSAGALGAVPTPVGDAYYFFNPFGDYWLGADYPPEAGAGVTVARYADDVAAAEDLLRRVPVGTWILTYNGFGGRLPAGYELVRVDWKLRGVLRLWRKRGDTARIGSPRTMKVQSRGQLALASRGPPCPGSLPRPTRNGAGEATDAEAWSMTMANHRQRIAFESQLLSVTQLSLQAEVESKLRAIKRLREQIERLSESRRGSRLHDARLLRKQIRSMLEVNQTVRNTLIELEQVARELVEDLEAEESL